MNFESMTKLELIKYAQKKHNLVLSDMLNKAQIIKEIEKVEQISVSEKGVANKKLLDKIAEQDKVIAELQKQINSNTRVINTSKNIYTVQDEKSFIQNFGHFANKFKAEKKIKVSIPIAYAKIIGRTLPINVMGAKVVIPVDSKEYEVPETFAKHLRKIMCGYDKSVFNAPARDIQEVK
jgi:hypothetical protein